MYYNCARNININFVESIVNYCSKAWQLCPCLWVKAKACQFMDKENKTDVINMLERGRCHAFCIQVCQSHLFCDWKARLWLESMSVTGKQITVILLIKDNTDVIDMLKSGRHGSCGRVCDWKMKACHFVDERQDMQMWWTCSNVEALITAIANKYIYYMALQIALFWT